MIDAPKTTLLNNIDDLDLFFIEGENELEFEIDDYSFVVTYSLEEDGFFTEDDERILQEFHLENREDGRKIYSQRRNAGQGI